MYNEEHFFTETIAPMPVSYWQDFCEGADTFLCYNAFPKESFLQIFKAVQEHTKKSNIPIQIVHSPLDGAVCGWMLPSLKTGAMRTQPFDFNIRTCFSAKDCAHTDAMERYLLSARQIFSRAHEVHDRQEEIYISRMDFDFANILCEALLNRLLLNPSNASDAAAGKKINRFFGAPTVNGNVCYIPELTENISKRYFIKGRPGTGKSTFLKRIASEVAERGYDVYLYHCSFDPKSLDMVIVPQLDVCLFDSTAPHEYFPTRPSDEMIDLYQECVVPGTDEKFRNELGALEAEYKAKLADGAVYLKKMKAEADVFEAQIPNLDASELESEINRVLRLTFKL